MYFLEEISSNYWLHMLKPEKNEYLYLQIDTMKL